MSFCDILFLSSTLLLLFKSIYIVSFFAPQLLILLFHLRATSFLSNSKKKGKESESAIETILLAGTFIMPSNKHRCQKEVVITFKNTTHRNLRKFIHNLSSMRVSNLSTFDYRFQLRFVNIFANLKQKKNLKRVISQQRKIYNV